MGISATQSKLQDEHQLDSWHTDPILRLSRTLFYLALFASSVLIARVGAFTIGDVLLVASLLLLLLVSALNQEIVWTPSPFPLWGTVLAACVFLFGAMLSVGNAILPEDSFSIVIRILLVAFIVPWQARRLLPTLSHIAVAAVWLLAGAAAAAAGSLLQYVAGPSIIPGGSVTDAGRFSGLTGHVSDLGGVASMGVVLGVGVLLYAQTRRGKLLALASIFAAAVGLILSGSVSGLICVGAGLLVYVFRRALKVRYLLLIVVIGLVVLAITATIQSAVNGLSPIERILQTVGISAGGRYSTTESRAETYEAAAQYVIGSPIVGHGFDSLSAIADGIFPPHNIVLGALFEGGVLTVLGLLAVASRPFRGHWLRAQRSTAATTMLATAISAIVFAMTAPSLYNRYFWLPLALLGACAAVSRTTHSKGETLVPSAQTRKSSLGARGA
ncbi:O-antigen ligase family protein [Cnuibacter physcomitrellae]|uniref:O-antigen ligase family protein n=1 Tax=Cnuibacter physcomitrellae TaxID=1619308 RepID=UPI0021757429|nr:O-antigen ligase family protein [Cnuibacter physcomitrellae]MCS5496106.1 O-antigen ligase family protein [Cnuibacter physcomitrellae]